MPVLLILFTTLSLEKRLEQRDVAIAFPTNETDADW